MYVICLVFGIKKVLGKEGCEVRVICGVVVLKSMVVMDLEGFSVVN